MSRRLLVGCSGAALALVALVALAEARGGDGPAGKSGASPAVSLRLAVAQYAGKPASRLAERYAHRVDALTNGSVRVVVVHWPDRLPTGTPSGHIEASAVRAVRTNAVQLGLLPAHAFEAYGVTSLRGLQAPFAVMSSSLAAQATARPVADVLQNGLEDISLVGLGLVPEGLERPFGFLKPFVAPADFAGVTVAADFAPTTRAALRALGARPVDLHSGGVETAILSGFAKGAASPPQADDEFPVNSYTVGNIAIFPKIDVVAASAATLDRLRPGQRAALRRAAAEVRAGALAGSPERAAASAFCAGGGTIVRAPASALTAFRAHVRPFVDELGRDPAARALFAELARSRVDDEGVPPCAPASPPTSPAPPLTDVPATVALRMLPSVGSYRRAFSAAELRAAGAGRADVERNAGITRLTFYGLDWRRFVIEWENSRRRPCRGGVELRGRSIVLRWNPATPCSGYVALRWRRAARGDLHIVSLDPRTEPVWLRRAYPGTWKRIECDPHCGAAEKLSAHETGLLLMRARGSAFVACHRVPSFAWDYECLETTASEGGQPVGAPFGVDVDAFGIVRTSR